MNSKIYLILMLCVSFTVLFANASAQSMGSTVKIVGVRFVAGKRQVNMRGVASDLVTYVYKLNVKRGQIIAVKVDSGEPELTFSVFSGKNERLGFGVKEWSDKIYASGTYSIVLTMNRERTALVRRLQYEADVRKRTNDEEMRRLKARLRNAEVEARGGSEIEKSIDAYADEKAAREFSQGMELFKLDRQIDELEATQKEKMEKIPYSLLIIVK